MEEEFDAFDTPRPVPPIVRRGGSLQAIGEVLPQVLARYLATDETSAAVSTVGTRAPRVAGCGGQPRYFSVRKPHWTRQSPPRQRLIS